jgi:hypothetical protein
MYKYGANDFIEFTNVTVAEMRSVANPFATLLGNGVSDDKSVVTEAKEGINGAALKSHKLQSPTPSRLPRTGSDKENDGAAKSASTATNSRKSTTNGNGPTKTPNKIPLEANNPEIATSSNKPKNKPETSVPPPLAPPAVLSRDEELKALAKQIEELTGSKISADAILALASKKKDNKTAEASGGSSGNCSKFKDRFSVGVMMGGNRSSSSNNNNTSSSSSNNNSKSSSGRSRLSSAGRESLDMRDFDLEEVKKHRMSLMAGTQPMPLPLPLDSPSSSSPRMGGISEVQQQQQQQQQQQGTACSTMSSAASIDSFTAITTATTDCNLLEFLSVGVDRRILAGTDMPDMRCRRQAVQVLNVFPTAQPLIENIADYCFPEGGAALELLTQDEAVRYSRTCRDSVHVLHFSDAKGKPTYGTVLTVREVYPTSFTKPVRSLMAGTSTSTTSSNGSRQDDENSHLVAFLLILQKRRRAAVAIQRFLAKRTAAMRVRVAFAAAKSKVENRMGSVVMEAMSRAKQDQTKQQQQQMGEAPRFADKKSIYHGITFVKKGGEDKEEEEKDKGAPQAQTQGHGQGGSTMAAMWSKWATARSTPFTSASSAKSSATTQQDTTAATTEGEDEDDEGDNLTPSLSLPLQHQQQQQHDHNHVSGRQAVTQALKLGQSRIFDNVEGLYEFFSDDEDSVSLTSGADRVRSRTESSIPEDGDSSIGLCREPSPAASASACASPLVQQQPKAPRHEYNTSAADSIRYYVATERAYCVLHDKPHHAAMTKVLIAIASKESLGLSSHDGLGLGNFGGAGGREVLREREEEVKARIVATARVATGRKQLQQQQKQEDDTAERDRAISTAVGCDTASMGGSIAAENKLACDILFAARTSRRSAFLRYIQSLPLSRVRGAIRGGRGGGGGGGAVKVSFPSYTTRSFQISASDRNSSCKNSSSAVNGAEDWMTATLFSVLPAEAVMQVLSVILMERSVVLYSSDAGLVTTIARALLGLMAPFTFAGAFVPLLPPTAREIMQAPVPFVVGTTVMPHLEREVSPQAIVLYIDDYLQTSSSSLADEGGVGDGGASPGLCRTKRYLHIPSGDTNTSSNTNSWPMGGDAFAQQATLDEDIAGASDPSLTSGGQRLCARIRQLAAQLRVGGNNSNNNASRAARSRDESVLSVRGAALQMVTFSLGMTRQERESVAGLRAAVMTHTREVLGDLVSGSSSCESATDAAAGGLAVATAHTNHYDEQQEGYSWARYGVLSADREEDFTFYPDWFLDQHRRKLRFLSAACTSQYFLAYVDELHLSDIKRTRAKRLLREWLAYRLALRAMKKEKKGEEKE